MERGQRLNQMLARADFLTCNILFDGCCKEGSVESAKHILEIMKRINIQSDDFAYNTLMDGWILFVWWNGQSQNNLRPAVDSGLNPNIVTYCSLMNSYCRKGQLNDASHLFDEIHAKGLHHTMVS